jgi:hypothetical protein
MSAIKSTMKAFTGKGDFESIYDELHKVYTGLLFGKSKNEMKADLSKIVRSLRKASERESEKNKKKLSYLNLIFQALVAWDAQSYGQYFEIEEAFNTMNSANKGDTIDKARSLLRRIIAEMKVLFEAELHVMNLSMRKLQGLGTRDEEAAKNEVYRAAGVVRGAPVNSASQKRITTVLARKQLGLPLNGSKNAGLENIVRNASSLLQVRLMPLPPSSKGGRKTRRNRKPRRSQKTRKY